MMITAENLRDFPAVDENIARPETLSQSLLAKHDNCPRSAYLSRKYKTSSVQMDRGTAFHMVPERATGLMLEQNEPTIPGEMAKELADAIMAEHPELVLPADEQDAVRAMAWNWAEATAIDLPAMERGEGIVGVEVPLVLELGGFKVTCRIDLVEVFGSTLYLTDYKTSLNIRKREEVQRGFQGKLYALAALEGAHAESGQAFGSGIIDVCFHETYPRYRDEETGKLIAKEGGWTRAELHEFKVSLERNIAVFEESLDTGLWPARDGSWCSECPAQGECPIPAHLRYVEEIETPQDAEDAFTHKMALERESERLQRGLRGWTQENGPIYVGDYAFDAKLERSREVIDWDQMLLALVRAADTNTPFVVEHHVRPKEFTKFAKRRITEEERDESGT